MTTLSVENYEQILQNNPGHPVFVRLANLYIDQGNCEKAVDVCQSGLMASPPAQVALVAHIIEAKALLQLDRMDEALAHLENSTELIPDDPQAYKLAGALLLEKKMFKEALPFLSNALARQPTDESLGRRLQECLKAIEEEKAAQANPQPVAPPSISTPEAKLSEPVESHGTSGANSVDEQPLKAPDAVNESGDVSPFDQLDASQLNLNELDGGDVLPTVVNQAAYAPGEPVPEVETVVPNQAPSSEKSPVPQVADALPLEPDPDSGEISEFLEVEDLDAPDEVAAVMSSSTETSLDGNDVTSQTEVAAISEGDFPTEADPSEAKADVSSPTPGEPTEEKPALSPFDQVLIDGASSEFDDIVVPTVVDQDAYVPGGSSAPTQAPSAAGNSKGDAPFDAVGSAGGFDEDLRDLSDIFRVLDSGYDDAAPQSDEAAPKFSTPFEAKSGSAPEDDLTAWEKSASTASSEINAGEPSKHSDSEAITPESKFTETPETQVEEVLELMDAEETDSEESSSPSKTAQAKDASADHRPESTPVLFDQVRTPTIPPPLLPHLSKEKALTTDSSKSGGKAPPALPQSPTNEPKHEDRGILSDLPDEAIFSTPPRPAAPSVAVASQAAGEIARQYEKELREKLLQQPPPSFWNRHWLKFAVALAALIIICGGGLFYRSINLAGKTERIQTWRQQTIQALTLATPQSYRDAIELSDRLLGENQLDPVAQAHKAYAAAALLHHFDESEASEKYRQMAVEGQDVARTATPGLSLAIDLWLTADSGDKGGHADVAKKLRNQNVEEIPNGFERAEVLLLQAEQSMAQKKPEKASQQLNQAMNAAQDHVDTFVTSGNWFMRPGDLRDPAKARTMFDRARQHSPENVEALVGLVEASLDQQGIAADDDKTLMVLIQKARTLFDASLNTPPAWNAELAPRIALAEGRLYGRLDRVQSAVETLEAGLNKYRGDKVMRRRFLLELGNIHAHSGAYDAAAVHFQDLMKDLATDKSRSRNLEMDLVARKSSATALLALGNPQGAWKAAADVTGLSGDLAKKANRELAILRGVALFEQHKFDRARIQLRSTAFDDGTHPTLAVIYMALIDGLTGDNDDLERAINLMNNIKESHRLWPLAKSVQGRLLLKKNDGKRAKLALTAAMQRDLRDWESPCLLGQFEAEVGNLNQARAALETAYSRNPFHDEAALWLAEVDMLLGDFEASEKILRALIDRKGSVSAQEALVYLAIAKGDLNGARFELTQLRKTHPRSDEASKASILFFAMNEKNSEFAAELKQAKKRFSLSNKLHLARRLIRLERSQEAASIYSALTKGSKAQNAQVGLVEIDLKSSDSKKKAAGLKSLDALLKAASAKDSQIEDETRARLLAADAQRLIDAQKKQQAKAQATAAVKANYFSPEAHLVLARINQVLGKTDTAIAELELSIRLDPAMADAYADLGRLLEKTKKNDVRAKFCLEMAIRLLPNSSPQKPELQKALTRLLNGATSKKGK